ncbi:membrane-bound lytic murein transglycosylase B [Alteromonadaceae bacterium Bs31]|nr:membrane-bound lytic murein transglycosylase B [Alteromonadaceae bacterium Bs31]
MLLINLVRSLLLFSMAALLLVSQVYADYSQHTKAAAFIDKMVNEHQFEREQVTAWLAAAEKKQSIIDAISRPAEKTKPWKEYRKIFLGQTRIDQGVEFWNDNAKTLRRASEELGVDEQIIVAIIGVETRYGRHTGKFRVLDALATLGFDYEPRASFFVKELENFLLLAREQKQDPLVLKGSYAGAMGFGQFIPSSYRAYAIDFDGDGFADIWNNPVDAIGSVAHYFKKHRWEKGEIVFSRARVAEGYDKSILNEKVRPHYSLQELAEKGFSPVNKNLRGEEKVVPLVYDGEHGKEFWLGFDNFYVITRYNRSQLYAMAVWQLSEELRYAYEQQLPL